MNIFLRTAFIGLLFVSCALASVVAPEAETSSESPKTTVSTFSSKETKQNITAVKDFSAGETVVKEMAGVKGTNTSDSADAQSEDKATKQNSVLVSTSISGNVARKNEKKASDVHIKNAQAIEIEDGNNAKLVNVAPETKHRGVADGNIQNNNVDTVSADIQLTTKEAETKPVNQARDIKESSLTEKDQKKGCSVKNSTCVPTREELIASGVNNVDFVQHRVSGPRVPVLKVDKPLADEPSDAGVSKPDIGCNVKNKTCVPTREELVAAGVSNVDMVQHRVSDFKPEKLDLKKISDNAPDMNVNQSDKTAACNVKNSTCVPKESDLKAAGVNTAEFIGQFSLDSEHIFLGQFKQKDVKSVEENSLTQADTVKNDSNPSLQQEMRTGNIVTGAVASEITKAAKPATAQQIPSPGPTTQQTNSTADSAIVDSLSTTDVVESKLESPKKQTPGDKNELINETTQRLTLSSVGSKPTTLQQQASTPTKQTITSLEQTTTSPRQEMKSTEHTTSFKPTTTSPGLTTTMTTAFQTCPKLNCSATCRYGRKVNVNGCETCECKFSDDCPRVLPSSRLLCLLQVRTSQGCTSNNDCKRNRICCPGTCGPICRRPSRSRSMLLSILAD